MAYTPRQIVVRAREAASLLVLTLERDASVTRFLGTYSQEQNRPAASFEPAYFRDLVERVQRESLLAMVRHLETLLPHRFEKLALPSRHAKSKTLRKKKPKPVPQKPGLSAPAVQLDLFLREFYVALGESLRWGKEEFDSFSRDLALYRKLSPEEAATTRPRFRSSAPSGPFVDRCAILLDPSLMEQARRAAARFEAQLRATAEKTLRKVFALRRAN